MKPTWERGNVRLYLGDCREVLPHVGKVDAVVTDIPYGEVNRDSGGLRLFDKGLADVETFSASWAAEQAARLGATAYLWCGTEQVSNIRKAMVDAGMTTRLCVWHKSNPSPCNGQYMWLSGLESCVFGRHPNAHFSVHCQVPIWHGPIEREQDHPTQKPVWLMRRLVEASIARGGSALDFCMGSGTTGVAAVQTGRSFIGIERDPTYFEIAVRRIDKAIDAGALFAPVPPAVREVGLFEPAKSGGAT